MRTPWRLVLIAWPVLSVLYALILVGNAEWPWRQGAIVGGTTIGVALLLGIPAWHLTGSVHIPDFTLASRSSSSTWSRRWPIQPLWLFIDLTATAVLLPHHLHQRKLMTMGWESMLGVWLYGVIAGVSYTVRGRHATALARQEAEATEARAVPRPNSKPWARLNPHFLFNALHSLGGWPGSTSHASTRRWMTSATCCARPSGPAARRLSR